MLRALHSFADYLWSQSWQLAPVFVLMLLLCLALRRAGAHWRYLLWSVVLLKCIVPAVVLVPMPVLDRVVEEAALATRQASPGGPDAQAEAPRCNVSFPTLEDRQHRASSHGSTCGPA